MKLTKKIKALFALLENEDAIARINQQVDAEARNIERIKEQVARLQAKQAEIEAKADAQFKDMQNKVAQVQDAVDALRNGFASLEDASRKKVLELAQTVKSFANDLQRQIADCKEQAAKLEPAIKRLADNVQELNG